MTPFWSVMALPVGRIGRRLGQRCTFVPHDSCAMLLSMHSEHHGPRGTKVSSKRNLAVCP